MALHQDISILRVNTEPLTATITSLPSGGLAAYGLIRFLAKRDNSDTDADALFTLTVGAGITITTNGSDTVDGVLSIEIPAPDTLALANYETVLSYDLTAYDETVNPVKPHVLAYGALTVGAHATQAAS